MVIGICDDDLIFRKGLEELCESFMTNVQNAEIVCFSSGEELLEYNYRIDILLLDIYMSGIDGMQVASVIREKDENMTIIFITGCHDYVREGYCVKAFRYLMKPIKKKELREAIEDAIGELTRNDKIIIEGIGGKVSYIRIRDIS